MMNSAASRFAPSAVYAALSAALLALATVVMLLATGTPARAAASDSFDFTYGASTRPVVSTQLLTVQDSVTPDITRLSGGLVVEMDDVWKTYWRSPGEVGLPPELDWSASTNIENVQFQYPAPTRYEAFGIENFGYADEVIFPLQIEVSDPTQPVNLRLSANILVCADVCIPVFFDLALDLPTGTATAIDAGSAARIASFANRVPDDGSNSGLQITAAHVDAHNALLTVTASSDTAFSAPDIFPEMGLYTTFGKPDLRIGEDGRSLWAQVPILSTSDPLPQLDVTITDGPRAATQTPALQSEAPAPPFGLASGAGASILWMLGLAFLGGLILNVMPCVLPVLSIKLTTAIKYRDHGPARVRGGFLMSTFGILTFMWALAAVLIAMRGAGMSVGWGLQFQSPVFLTVVILLITLFAANLFGMFEFTLPSALQSRMARADAAPGYAGDFATGAFAALMATPCSAPILGTAVAFALAGSPADIVMIFTALGIGLAAPYLVVAIWPGMIARLPKPGRWMVGLKLVLGLMLAATAVWLLSVLLAAAGPRLAGLVAAGLVALLAVLALRTSLRRRGSLGIAAAIIALPLLLPAQTLAPTAPTGIWTSFDHGEIMRQVTNGQIVFVDVTADWCLTCKANKSLVLDRDPTLTRLTAADVTAMQADWTRPDPAIGEYLQGYGRYGIPFNIVYGPAAPDGIPLPELLTADIVEAALQQAAGN